MLQILHIYCVVHDAVLVDFIRSYFAMRAKFMREQER